MPLTGRFNFQRTWTGKVVLLVEEDRTRWWPFNRISPTRRVWRPARLWDLAQPELRALMDLRNKAHLPGLATPVRPPQEPPRLLRGPDDQAP